MGAGHALLAALFIDQSEVDGDAGAVAGPGNPGIEEHAGAAADGHEGELDLWRTPSIPNTDGEAERTKLILHAFQFEGGLAAQKAGHVRRVEGAVGDVLAGAVLEGHGDIGQEGADIDEAELSGLLDGGAFHNGASALDRHRAAWKRRGYQHHCPEGSHDRNHADLFFLSCH